MLVMEGQRDHWRLHRWLMGVELLDAVLKVSAFEDVTVEPGRQRLLTLERVVWGLTCLKFMKSLLQLKVNIHGVYDVLGLELIKKFVNILFDVSQSCLHGLKNTQAIQGI